MHQGQNATKNLRDKGETPTGMVHALHINKTTTLPLSTEEERRKAISEDHDIGYIKRILSSPEEKTIDTKLLIKMGMSNHFIKEVRRWKMD